MSIEAARSEQSRIENLWPVRGRHDDHTCVGVKPIHFSQQLIERLLLLVVPAHRIHASCFSESVEFIDEDNARRVILGLSEEIPHPGRTDADEHFNKARTADGEEGDIGLSGHGLGQERLPCSWCAHEKNAFGNLSSEALELF